MHFNVHPGDLLSNSVCIWFLGPYQPAAAMSSPYSTPTGIGSSKRRTRTVFDNQAVSYLESQFNQDAYPDYDTRCFYANRLGVTEDRIQVCQVIADQSL